MTRTLLMIALAFCLEAQASAALVGLDDYHIDPPGAGIHGQTVSITLSGIWLDTCVPEFILHEVTDDQIIVTAVNPGGPTIGCGDALTPWELETTLGPLTHGAYDIVGQLAHYNWPDTSDIVIDHGPELLIENYAVNFLLGDMNGDGQLDAFDVHAFELALADVDAYRAQYLDVDPVEVGNFAEDTVFNSFDTAGFEGALAGGDVVVVPEPSSWWVLAGTVGLWLLHDRRMSKPSRRCGAGAQ